MIDFRQLTTSEEKEKLDFGIRLKKSLTSKGIGIVESIVGSSILSNFRTFISNTFSAFYKLGILYAYSFSNFFSRALR